MSTSIFTLWGCWWRSQLLIAIDLIVTFTCAWIVLTCGSIYSSWAIPILNFFCSYTKYSVVEQNPDAITAAADVCSESATLAIALSLIWMIVVFYVVSFVLPICAFMSKCCKPHVWQKTRRRSIRQSPSFVTKTNVRR